MDQFSAYLDNLIEDWQGKIDGLIHEEAKYLRRKSTALQQVSYLKVKLSSIAEAKKEFQSQLKAAQRKLTELKGSCSKS